MTIATSPVAPRRRVAAPSVPRPFVKWAGGKTQLLRHLDAYFPDPWPGVARYFEPFVGGGAVFFHLRRTRRDDFHAILADANGDLIGAYDAIRRDHAAVAAALDAHTVAHDEGYYYRVRASQGDEVDLERREVEDAARLIYLNKAGYNGLYRVNRQGEFNVPWGRSDTVTTHDPENLTAVSRALANSFALTGDFEPILTGNGFRQSPREGDFVYLDPPYDAPDGNFTAYTARDGRNSFDRGEQVRLAGIVRQLDRRGVRFVASNADTPFVRDLYGGFHLAEVSGRRSINRDGGGRGPVGELIISNVAPRDRVEA